MEIKRGDKMKWIFIDTNLTNENGSIHVSDILVKNLDVQIGEKVIVYQNAEAWQAEIVYDKNCWGAMIISEAQIIEKERQEGQRDGFWAGYYVQSMRLLRALEQLEYSATDIERIKDKLGLK